MYWRMAKSPNIPLSLLRKLSIILRLMKLKKFVTYPLKYQRLHVELRGQFEDHLSVYTDSFKDQSRVAAVPVCQQKKFGICMPGQSSIYTVEAQRLMLECMEVSNHTKYFVYSDSFSCLQAVVAGLKRTTLCGNRHLQNEPASKSWIWYPPVLGAWPCWHQRKKVNRSGCKEGSGLWCKAMSYLTVWSVWQIATHIKSK